MTATKIRRRAFRRPCIAAGTSRRAFTLVELVISLLLAMCLIGWYVRTLEEADWLAMSMYEGRVLTIEQKAVHRQWLLSVAAEAQAKPDQNAGEHAPDPAIAEPPIDSGQTPARIHRRK